MNVTAPTIWFRDWCQCRRIEAAVTRRCGTSARKLYIDRLSSGFFLYSWRLTLVSDHRADHRGAYSALDFLRNLARESRGNKLLTDTAQAWQSKHREAYRAETREAHDRGKSIVRANLHWRIVSLPPDQR